MFFSKLFRTLKFCFLLFIIAFFVLFAVVNRETISISLFPLPYAADLPKFLLAIICFSLGLLAGGIIMSLKLGRTLRMLKHEHQQVIALKNEVAGYQVMQSPPAA